MQYSISHFKNQTFVLFLFRQPNGHHRAAALGIADVKGTTMESDDLIAHRKTDAAAPGLGGALVKLLLYIGQLRLWKDVYKRQIPASPAISGAGSAFPSL